MGRKKFTNFDESALLNNYTYIQYADRLKELAMTMFEWKNLPDGVDPRFLELSLFENGSAVFFYDEEIGDYLGLQMMQGGNFDVYGNPYKRVAWSPYNNYQKNLDVDNSVVVWNNYLRKNSYLDCVMFGRRLYNIDRTIDINVNAQKTPVLVRSSNNQKLTLKNLYKEYDGNAPVIYAYDDLNVSALTVLKTDAPYVAGNLWELKQNIWNEALTYLGISNISFQKKERLITDEVARGQGGVVASRFGRLEARKEACDKINKMFGLEISVDVREDLDYSMPSGGDDIE